jgi:hypothetical protein
MDSFTLGEKVTKVLYEKKNCTVTRNGTFCVRTFRGCTGYPDYSQPECRRSCELEIVCPPAYERCVRAPMFVSAQFKCTGT